MANKERGQIPADFQGGKINLVLSTNSICELEDAAGKPVTAILGELDNPEGVSMKTVRLMFWAMMLEDKGDATLKDAGALIDELRGKHDEIMTKAILAAFPEAGEDEGGEPGK